MPLASVRVVTVISALAGFACSKSSHGEPALDQEGGHAAGPSEPAAVAESSSGPALEPAQATTGAQAEADIPTKLPAAKDAAPDAELPPWQAFTDPTRDDHWRAPAKASAREWLDDAHAVAVVRSEQGEGEEQRWRISLVRVAREGDAWVFDGMRELERWTAFEELERDGSIAVNLRVEDLDDDGAKEVATRHNLAWMCGGGGPTQKRTLVISNDDATLSEAAYVDLDEALASAEVFGRETFEDRDHDGHPDLVVTWKTVIEGEPDEVSEKVFAWKRSDDRYADAKRPVGEDDYCN